MFNDFPGFHQHTHRHALHVTWQKFYLNGSPSSFVFNHSHTNDGWAPVQEARLTIRNCSMSCSRTLKQMGRRSRVLTANPEISGRATLSPEPQPPRGDKKNNASVSGAHLTFSPPTACSEYSLLPVGGCCPLRLLQPPASCQAGPT